MCNYARSICIIVFTVIVFKSASLFTVDPHFFVLFKTSREWNDFSPSQVPIGLVVNNEVMLAWLIGPPGLESHLDRVFLLLIIPFFLIWHLFRSKEAYFSIGRDLFSCFRKFAGNFFPHLNPSWFAIFAEISD